MADSARDTSAELRYLSADHVSCPGGTLAEFTVVTQDDKALGTVGGVLINPSHRRCEYLVIDSTGLFSRRRVLLPVQEAAVVQEEGPRVLKIVARRDELPLQPFSQSSVAQFSDEDLVTAMFSRHAAA